jgi:hypothetical protein
MNSKEIHMPQNTMPKHGKYNLVFWTKLTSIVAEQLVTGQKTPWLCCLCEHKNTDQGKLAASIDEWRRISS